jgi:hypothetical protein
MCRNIEMGQRGLQSPNRRVQAALYCSDGNLQGFRRLAVLQALVIDQDQDFLE